MGGRILGYSVHADETRATIVSEGLRLRGIEYEIMPTMSFYNGQEKHFPTFDIEGSEEAAHFLPQADLRVLAVVG